MSRKFEKPFLVTSLPMNASGLWRQREHDREESIVWKAMKEDCNVMFSIEKWIRGGGAKKKSESGRCQQHTLNPVPSIVGTTRFNHVLEKDYLDLIFVYVCFR